MHREKACWGLFIFIFSPLLIAGSYLLVNLYPPEYNRIIYQSVFPVVCVVFSLISFFAGHFSYPRVHNLKVYLIGYLTGLTGTGYLIYSRFIERPVYHITVLYLCIFLNFIFVLILPSYIKYRTTRRFTRSIVIMELMLLIGIYFMPVLIKWTHIFTFSDFYHYAAWGPILWMGFVLLTSMTFIRNEFHFGGVLSGCALFYVAAWLSPLFTSKTSGMEQVLFAIAPVYLVSGILIHWFSRMEHRASYDPLLQVYNRNYCSRIIEEQSNTNTSPPFGVAMIDIDHFKNINDTYGHQAGDRVLFNVAQTIQQEVVPGGIVCRYGGEEIAVFFPGKQTKKIAPIMERVRAKIENMKVGGGRKNLSVTVSCGIAHRNKASQSISDVVHNADKALYSAKRNGRNQVRTASKRYSRPKMKKP